MSTSIQEATRIAPPGTWTLDPVHSSVGFEIAYLAGTFKGEFRKVAATLTVDGENERLEGTAEVASVDVKDENLAAHLQSPEFFNAERHPGLRFAAEDVRADGDSVGARGEITIKGTTRPVELSGTATPPIVDGFGKDRFGLKLSATVDRTEFGLLWNMPLPSGEQSLADDVTILADLQFVKAA